MLHYEAYTMIGHHTLLAIECHAVTTPCGEKLGNVFTVTRSVAAHDYQSPQLIAECKDTEREIEHTTQNLAQAFETYARLSMAEMTNELFERASDEGRTYG